MSTRNKVLAFTLAALVALVVVIASSGEPTAPAEPYRTTLDPARTAPARVTAPAVVDPVVLACEKEARESARVYAKIKKFGAAQTAALAKNWTQKKCHPTALQIRLDALRDTDKYRKCFKGWERFYRKDRTRWGGSDPRACMEWSADDECLFKVDSDAPETDRRKPAGCLE